MTDATKNPLGRTLNTFAERKVRDAIHRLGKSLPCTVESASGSIVTVNFEINSGYTLPRVQVPVLGSEYVRLPLQPGCKGLVLAADAYLGGVSGLGGGTADLTQRGNLTTLVFTPIGNTAFSAVDPDMLVLYGPTGVTIQTPDGSVKLELTSSGLALTGGTLTHNGVNVGATHLHTGVQAGAAETGPPAP